MIRLAKGEGARSPARNPVPPAPAPAADVSPLNANLIGPEIVVSLAEIVGFDPCNARQAPPAEVEAMAAQLREQGQIHPLLLRAIPGLGYRVLAGRRRWLGFLKNAGGDLASVTVRARLFNGGDAEAREASLAENVAREDLHPLDEVERFAELAKAFGIERLARDFGATRRTLRGKLALAALSARVRAAWRAGAFGLETARAFTLARGEAEQDALLDAPDFAAIARFPLDVRRRLAARAVPMSAPAALFVGAEDYLAAGGVIAEDLFGEEPLLLDRALLETLEKKKLAAEATALRVAEGWGFTVDDPAGEGCRRVAPDYRDEEREALALADGILAATDSPDEAQRLTAEREAIERVATLRAVAAADRHRYGIAVSVDAEGRLAVERGLERPAAPIAADSPFAAARTSEPPLGRDDGSAADPRPPLAARRPAAPPRPRGAGEAFDAPLAPAARRLVLTAATRAIADEVASQPELALCLAVAAFAAPGPHGRPVAVRREQGPRGAKTRALAELGRLSFAEALAAVLAWPTHQVLAGFAECVAASLDLREAYPDDARALLDEAAAAFDDDAARQAGRPAELAAAIAAALDYPAFFRAASPATALVALRACGGPALEAQHAGKTPDALAEEAARIARAKGWLPDCVAPEPPRLAGREEWRAP